MEPHTQALETVCMYFKQEYGEQAMVKLRREKKCLASQNYRLRKKIGRLQELVRILDARADRLVTVQRELVLQMQHAHKSLSVAVPYL